MLRERACAGVPSATARFGGVIAAAQLRWRSPARQIRFSYRFFRRLPSAGVCGLRLHGRRGEPIERGVAALLAINRRYATSEPRTGRDCRERPPLGDGGEDVQGESVRLRHIAGDELRPAVQRSHIAERGRAMRLAPGQELSHRAGISPPRVRVAAAMNSRKRNDTRSPAVVTSAGRAAAGRGVGAAWLTARFRGAAPPAHRAAPVGSGSWSLSAG
jgi:hypothetical protein